MGVPLGDAGLLALAVALGLFLARSSRLLGIPALLLGGVALGRDGLGILQDTAFLGATSDLGLVLLLFYTALFAHPRALRDGGRIALPLAAYDLVLNFAAAYWLGELFGWDLTSRLFLAGVLATSSTGTILKILTDEGRLMRKEGQVLLALLWIEDLAFIAYFGFIAAHTGLAGALTRWQGYAALAAFALVLALIRLSRERVWRVQAPEVLIPLVTGIGVLGTSIASLAGLPYLAGAFTTGLALSGSRGARFVQTEAPWLREVAAALFFLPFGALIKIDAAVSVLPMAAAAIAALVFTELLFLPHVSRLLGLARTEAAVVGASLLSRGGKAASFARLGADVAPFGAQIHGLSGLLTVLLTPLSPLLVRLLLRNARPSAAPEAQRRDVLSQLSRRVLAPREFAQRHLVPWPDRVALVASFLLPALLGILASLLPFPLRWLPLALAAPALAIAWMQARTFFSSVPGTASTTLRLRHRALPGLEDFVAPLLLGPTGLCILLPLAAPAAGVTFPLLVSAAFLAILVLPRIVAPGQRHLRWGSPFRGRAVARSRPTPARP